MTFVLKPEPRKRSWLAGFSLSLAFFAALVTAYSAALIRLRSVEAAAAFPAFLSGLALAVLAAALAIAAMAVVWRTGRTGGVRAFFALVVAALTLGGPGYVAGSRLAAPALTDVSTDLADPPRLDRAAADRGKADLPVPTSIPAEQAATQRAAYPDLVTLRLALPAEEVSNLAVGLVEERGWRLLGPTSYPRGGGPTGRIEAVARTPILGLADDVSIRIRADGDGTRVDMRSASRFGFRDFGANAARVRSFFADLSAAANVAP